MRAHLLHFIAGALLAAVASLPAAAGPGRALGPSAVHLTGNPVRGEDLYGRCMGCHALQHDTVGPRHCGLIGRRAGSVAGFDYSTAMKQSHLVWDAPTLDRFLAAPMRVVPGTKMTYAGVDQAQDRADLIAYLQAAGSSPTCHTR